MDLTVIRQKIAELGSKYRYVVIILIAGILLMLLPVKSENDTEPLPAETVRQTDPLGIKGAELEHLLSQIKGTGKVEVLLTLAAGERTLYCSDERSTSSDSGQTLEHQTVIITNTNRSEDPLIERILAPEYLGAVVVCQGADDPAVRLAVTDAVSKATGLGTDRISVLRMN